MGMLFTLQMLRAKGKRGYQWVGEKAEWETVMHTYAHMPHIRTHATYTHTQGPKHPMTRVLYGF